MKKIIFDTETTGFKPGSICQLSYIIDDNGALTAKNIFFDVEYIEPGAIGVHGFTVEILRKLSNGCGFRVHADSILEDFKDASPLIAHNFDFDKKFLSTEFDRLGKRLRIQQNFCTMKYFTPICKLPPTNAYSSYKAKYKYPTLGELVTFFEITQNEIASFVLELFEIPQGSHFHDARFDAAATYLCYKKALEQGLI